MSPVLGFDLGASVLRGGLIDEEGRFISRAKRTTGHLSFKRFLATLIVLQKELDPEKSARAVGLGVPSPISLDGKLINPLPWWGRVGVKEAVERATHLPVSLGNDADLALLGEAWKGAARGKRYVVMITVGTGIGAGILIERRLYRGAHGAASEFGHMLVGPGRRACRSGHERCLEAYGSGLAMYQRSGKLVHDLLKSRELRDRTVLAEGLQALASALHNFAMLLDPEVVIIGGGVASPAFVRRLGKEIRIFDIEIPIVRAELGEWAGVFGAAWEALGLL